LEGQAECQFCDDFIKRSTTEEKGATSVDACACKMKYYQDGDQCVDAGFGVEMGVAEATLETLPLQGGF